jgi:DNA-binding NtrC family response regulator
MNEGTEGGFPPRKQVVLVVDDEPMIRLALAVHLDEKGFEVREAGSADEAVAILQEPGCVVNLVFSDVRMPGEMDGIGLSRWIFENRPNIAVILASGDIGKMTAMDDLCGADAITKPYNYEVATNKIREAIRKKMPPLGS